MEKYPRVMLTAGASGSGKTMITCGILQALKNRGLDVISFKCGPDYIDPMFHEKVIHTRARNLDPFFAGEEMLRYLFCKHASTSDISLIEGVMGYFDGVGGIQLEGSACDLAEKTNTPVILVVNARGMSRSAAAYVKGFLTYRQPTKIQGIILNQISEMMYPVLKEQIEEELGIRVYGYMPYLPDCLLESRHLGLVLPEEVQMLEEKLQNIAQVLEKTLDLDALIQLANQAGSVGEQKHAQEEIKTWIQTAAGKKEMPPLRIAVSRDEAFCFIYEDNLQLLREMGAELVYFSPIHDRRIPEADGVLLYGGYPELYAEKLSENNTMRCDVKAKLTDGMPCMAECGGFMYLHQKMEGMDGQKYPMAGVIEGEIYRTEKLQRFGYVELKDCKGTDPLVLKAHEFHYFDSTACGQSYLAQKPTGRRSWYCMHKTDTMLAGFPHFYYYANPELAVRFLDACRHYREKKDERT